MLIVISSEITQSTIYVPNETNTGPVPFLTTIHDIDDRDGRALPRGWVEWKNKSWVVVRKSGKWWLETPIPITRKRTKWTRYNNWIDKRHIND